MLSRLNQPPSKGVGYNDREAAARPLSGALPLDLREWFATEVLRQWLEEEVNSLDWDHPLVQEHLKQNPELRPKVLLRLLAWGYATQVFNTKELISKCRSDVPYSELCEGNIPFPHELTGFRRKNRRLIVRVLSGIFGRAVKRRFQLIPDLVNSDMQKAMEDRANARLDIARHMDVGDED